MASLVEIRSTLRRNHLRNEDDVLTDLTEAYPHSAAERAVVRNSATDLVKAIRADGNPGLMEVFLAEYGLSTNEGVALMCLAEALLRVPDAETIDALIEDKIAPSAWGQHLGQSSSSLVNASTWALMLTGKVLQDGNGLVATLKGAVKRLGEPVIRAAVGRAMKEMGAQFVLGQTIEEAVKRGKQKENEGYTYSYDMLGEAALTASDAQAFLTAYTDAIANLAAECRSNDIRENPGISIKLSALHPRYEVGQKDRVMQELVPVTLQLAQQAKIAGMGLNIDAEEADRLELSMDVIEAVLRDPSLAGWDGFGVVVQAYGKRAPQVIDWLHTLADELDRKIMVRLVKGAYWDTEVKRAQVEGLPGFPVYTRKVATDISYICCARKLLGMTDRIYPQFATHNAHTVAAILETAKDKSVFEFQRLHGMGDSLHDLVLKQHGTRCRIYAPVGAHRDLLAYLVRRLLENGANSSFVNQIVDKNVSAETVAADPFEAYGTGGLNAAVRMPVDLYGDERPNSRGWDLHDVDDLAEVEAARKPFQSHVWKVGPLIDGPVTGDEERLVVSPSNHDDKVGTVLQSGPADVDTALDSAQPWVADAKARADVLNRAADLYEANFGELFAALTREAGKTSLDAISELREAVDFLRFYAARGLELKNPARGVIACISPWNFPLAIFTGQIAAALAAGNAVIAKPADPTSIVASVGVRLMHKAGVPTSVLQLLPGRGSVVGARITADPRIKGVCFTGSTHTAQTINRTMVEQIAPGAPLIAETGGLNAMIVDSTALPEQAIKDIVASAFQSAGQRCSALRLLYVQEDVAEPFLNMLYGAMDELVVGDPWLMSTDVGPVINEGARAEITEYIETARAKSRVLKELHSVSRGTFVSPTVLEVSGIADLEKEVFGPVMHVATYKASDLDAVVADINATGFGLTFGMHSRIDDRIEQVTSQLNVGNMYINRNQIGAIVGSQPFGGEGLSGTGPKAGGPSYVKRFALPDARHILAAAGQPVETSDVQRVIDVTERPARRPLRQISLPGPTGESNVLSVFGRGVFLCLGPTEDAARQQAQIARAHGCKAVLIAPGAAGDDCIDGSLEPHQLRELTGFEAVVSWAPEEEQKAFRKSLADRKGALIPLVVDEDFGERCLLERHVCVDTTAAGGNASLLAQAS
ncbi:bifunctional proline dehydrogenase/L-glutamate gamma-semialdehyde dehydrogenase PutA [Tropicibacter sp. Alg240-R139]|uniref:bifunctional proline dehydrogenase/L-glutamate gamma-semialdehyde dehydrogenase PutA n=1 Tax=Tropicibacter sp. Alg240-R139 TaxID=2305991 RepID=UPI0013E0872A|nr:bifunctional proline dehydrogenase/L-glutamate gamma-semialdehyde dehydrogenase PutA [Tropicibacter sp. Alg240-R139]